MHLGFSVVALAILSNVLVAVVAAVLVAIVYGVERRRGRVRANWVGAAALLPLIVAAYMWAGFFAYVGWCDFVRGVDVGVFDENKRLPLGYGYTLEIIPSYRQQFLTAPGGERSHDGLRQIGSNEKFLVGEDDQGFFLLDLERHRTHRTRSPAELQLKLSSEGAMQIELLTPDELYARRRWGMADAIAAALIVVPPFASVFVFGWRFVQSSKAA